MTASKLPKITVAICTRDRAEQLNKGLSTLVQLEVPAELVWEVLVVDNGSSDHTAGVIDNFKERLPIRRLFEPEAGLSYARNHAVSAASGDYICWTDDDTCLDSGWLIAYLNAFERHPDGAIFAGQVRPVLEGKPPPWFVENQTLLSGLIAECKFGDVPRALDTQSNEWPIGANFALRMHEQKQHSFNVLLGVSPKFKRLGEETAVIRAIAAQGGVAYYVPDSIVDHYIPEARQTPEYVLVYHRSAGETWAVLACSKIPQFMGRPMPLTGRRTFKGAPFWLWRLTLKNWLSYQTAKLLSDPKNWLPRLQRYGYYRGALDYFVRERL